MEAKLHVDLDDENISKLVEMAIMEKMSPDTRDRIIQQSVEAILKKDGDKLSGKSALQWAFDRAVERACYNYAEQHLATNTEFQAELGQLFESAWKRVTEDKDAREKLIDNIASTMRRTITGDRY